VNLIDKRVKKFGDRLYTVDFMFENQKPLLIEMNSSPTLYLSTKKFYKDMLVMIDKRLS